MIRNYFKIAWRNIVKHKLSSTINIFGIVLGITSCVVLLLFVKYESSFDDGHSKSELTYRLVQHKEFPEETFYLNVTPYPLAEALRNDLPGLNNVTQIVGLTTQILGVENSQGVLSSFKESNIMFVDDYYSKVFDNINWLTGHKLNALNDSNSIVLTENLANKYFDIKQENYKSIVGKVVMLNNNEPLLVKGVVENPSGNTNYKYGALLPYKLFKKNNKRYANNWSVNHQGTTFVVLNNENDREAVESKIALWKKKYLNPKDDKLINYLLQPLNEVHTNALYGSSPGGYIMPVKIINIVTIVAFFILCIAIVNFINLVTAQSILRSKEVGVLKVLGSNKLGLVFRFVIENSLLIFIALCLSLITIYLSLDKLNDLLSVINLDLKLQWNHLYLVLGISLVTVLLATVYPAVVMSSFNPTRAFKNNGLSKKVRGLTLRKGLITFQFVIVQILVIVVMVITMQMRFFKSKDVGFSSDSVVITSVPEFDKIDIFKNSLLSHNEISEVSFGSGPPMGIDGLSLGTSFRLPNTENEDGIYSEMKIGDANYLNFYDLELLAGKNFTSTKDKFDQFIVNETLLKYYNWSPEEAIGKKLAINEGEAIIVGVVKDYHNNALQYEITPSIIVNWNILQNNAFVKVSNTDAATLANIESIWKSSFKSSVYNYSFLDDAIEREYVVERLIYNGFSILSILAIILGCLGLFGLMAFILVSKSKELAIRKILGSSTIQITTLLSKEYLTLIIIAFFVAAPLSYYALSLWLQDFSYRITLSLGVFLFGGVLTLFITLITCSFQSIKMALMNPVKSLRTE